MLRFQFFICFLLLNTMFPAFFIKNTSVAQLPVENTIYISTLSSNTILNYNPALPMSATNPGVNTITRPPGSNGLAISPVLGSGNTDRTFYTTVTDPNNNTIINYWHYDINAGIWVNTGHLAEEYNPGAGGGFMYCIRGGVTGLTPVRIYKYDGTGNSTLLLTFPISNSKPILDIEVDCEGNFYVLSINPESYLKKYNSNGILLQQWTINNPNNYAPGAGYGFSIIGNKVYLGIETATTSDIAVGTIGNTSVNFIDPLVPIFGGLLNEDFATAVTTASSPAIVISIAPDTVICPGVTAIFTAVISGAGQNPSYQWFVNGALVPGQTNATFSYNPNDGDMVRCQTMVAPGECFLGGTIVSNIITIHVKEPPLPVLEYNPSVFCIGQQESVTPLFSPSGGTFNATPAGLNIDIATGTIDINASTPGNYAITYKTQLMEGCEQHSITDMVTISALPLADIGYANNPENICLGDTFNLQTPFETGNRYEWLPQSYFPVGNREAAVTATVRENGVIYLTVVNEAGCINSDTVLLKGKPCCNMFIPNAFSPNGDNHNDFFLPYSTNPQKINQLSIYNRWGERVFVSFAQKDGWNGYHKDKPADGGTYFYYLSYECADGTIYIKKGDLTLLR